MLASFYLLLCHKSWDNKIVLEFILDKASSSDNNTVFALNLAFINYYCVISIVETRALAKINMDHKGLEAKFYGH